MIRYLTAGESHGPSLTGIVEGCPAGVVVTREAINRQLARRWLGYGRGGRAKFERDVIEISSGVRFSKSMGSPISLHLQNNAYTKDKSGWPDIMSVEGAGTGVEKVTRPRPGHADLVGLQKYRFDDIRPVIERASARETAMRVGCCTVARLFLESVGVHVNSHVVAIGGVGYSDDERDELVAAATAKPQGVNEVADASEVRVLSERVSAEIVDRIRTAKSNGDSLGGSYEVIVTGVPAGLGSYVHWDRRLDGMIAQAIMSIQAQKAVEIGDGIEGSGLPGSRVHDEILPGYDRSSNRAGGIEGGISNGMPIVVRGYMKPIPTLIKPLQSVDLATGKAVPTRYERSDITSVPAASVVAEAVVAVPIANAILEKFGGDSIEEVRERFRG